MKAPRVPIASTAGRAAAELAIIVTGVLIALGAQSWWEDRGEAEERERALEALASDLEVIALSLEEVEKSANELAEITILPPNPHSSLEVGIIDRCPDLQRPWPVLDVDELDHGFRAGRSPPRPTRSAKKPPGPLIFRL